MFRLQSIQIAVIQLINVNVSIAIVIDATKRAIVVEIVHQAVVVPVTKQPKKVDRYVFIRVYLQFPFVRPLANRGDVMSRIDTSTYNTSAFDKLDHTLSIYSEHLCDEPR